MMVETDKANLIARAQQQLEQAYTYEEETQLEDALRHCDLAIEIVPDLADAHNLRGIILEQLGQKEQAIVAYGEAVHLKPNFEEARQNLHELQNEVKQFQRVLDQRQAWKVALWGAIGYGISFAVINAIMAIVRMQEVTQTVSGVWVRSPKYGFYPRLVLSTLLYTLGNGFCAAVLGKISRSKRAKWLSVAGALGFGIAYSVTFIVYQVLVPFFLLRGLLMDTFFTTVASVVQFTLAGLCTGFLIGLAQRDAKRLVWSSLAGGAFGLYGFLSPAIFSLAFSISMSGLVPGSLRDVMHASIVFAIAEAIYGVLVGGIGGALLGLVVGWPKSDSESPST